MPDISRNHGRAVVVGLDGSPGSERALRWAAQEARLRAAPLRVVLAWEAPTQLAAGAGWVPPGAERLEELAAAARARLDAAIAAIGEELEGVEVEVRAERGAAEAVLVEAARDASLLVVGTRGHGPVGDLLLGSVSLACTQRAPCPVVVVPGR